LSEYDGQITVRQLYYRLVAAQVIENTQKSYRRLDAHLVKWRKTGLLPMDAFCDLTREPVAPNLWADLSDFFDTVRRAYRRDPWQSQSCRPEVWCEKEALQTVFSPVCREYGVVLQMCRGFASVSCLSEAAERTKHVLYFGDFDPSGESIGESIARELPNTHRAKAGLVRIALTSEQVEQYRLPPAIPKPTDSRTAAFVARHGERAVELDALPPNVLQELIRDAIEACITDPARWDEETGREAEEREKLRGMV